MGTHFYGCTDLKTRHFPPFPNQFFSFHLPWHGNCCCLRVLTETIFSQLCTWVGVRLAFSALYLVFELGMVYFNFIFKIPLVFSAKIFIFILKNKNLFVVFGHVIIFSISPADPLSLCVGFGSSSQFVSDKKRNAI